MNNRTSSVAKVDVGKPPSGFRPWESAEVYFHGFADLAAGREDVAKSPEFECLGHRWRLVVFPGGDRTARDGKASIYLCSMADESVEIDFFWSVKDSSSKEAARSEMNTYNFPPDGARGCDINRSIMLKVLVEGTLIVEVKMRDVAAPTSSSSAAFVPGNPLCIENILKHFMDEESADVAFEVGGEGNQGKRTRKKAKTSTTFYAHRFILQIGAPMLAELCKPGGGGDAISVPIDDVRPEIFRHILYYVYGGKISDDEVKASAQEIVDAADKFGIVNLKLEAEACCVKSTIFTVDNILDNLLYAESKNCALLKEAVMDFIMENGDVILGKVSFNNVPGSIVTDLLAAVTRGKKKVDGSGDGSNYNTMRVGTLRKLLHKKGLDVDGSREAMVALLKQNS